MARLPRLVIPHQPHHILQRGNDRAVIFRDDADHLAFLGWLRDAAKQFRVAIHAYVLLPTQLNLLATPSDQTGLSRMMQWVGRHYVPYFNQKYQRSGTLWEGRYKATVLDAERYFMICTRYIESLPEQAGTGAGANPTAYPWSSYPHHAGIRPDPLVTDHALYWALGNTPFAREIAHKNLLEHPLTAEEAQVLNTATIKGWALGSDKFKAGLEKQTQRRMSPARRGRPVLKDKPHSS